jgi:protein-S-isoprenylcysteine O-methyltransferase Ste14
MRALALVAIIPAAATLYFGAFWTWFAFWRRHPALTYAMMIGTIAGFAAAIVLGREAVLEPAIAVPLPIRIGGACLIAAALVVGTIADRQIGFHVRSFAPYFEHRGRIALVTTGAYGLVRHPIYASGIWFQLGTFLATGFLAVAAACLVFGLGAAWFTRQEERRLVTLLDDPSAYERYRARVPALLPRIRRA